MKISRRLMLQTVMEGAAATFSDQLQHVEHWIAAGHSMVGYIDLTAHRLPFTGCNPLATPVCASKNPTASAPGNMSPAHGHC